MPTIPLKTVSDLYQKARKKREWWHNGGRGYSAYMFTDGQFLLAHDGSVIFDYDPRKGTYAVSGSTPADRDAIDSMFRILGIKDAASNLNGPISLKNGRVQGVFRPTGAVPTFYEHLKSRGLHLDAALFDPAQHRDVRLEIRGH